MLPSSSASQFSERTEAQLCAPSSISPDPEIALGLYHHTAPGVKSQMGPSSRKIFPRAIQVVTPTHSWWLVSCFFVDVGIPRRGQCRVGGKLWMAQTRGVPPFLAHVQLWAFSSSPGLNSPLSPSVSLCLCPVLSDSPIHFLPHFQRQSLNSLLGSF